MANVGRIAVLHPNVMQQLGLKWGEFISVHFPDQDTFLVRQLMLIQCREKIRQDTVYVDLDAMKLLCANVLDRVEISRSDYDMSFP